MNSDHDRLHIYLQQWFPEFGYRPADAAYVVTNDRHLLDLKSYRGIAIVTIDEFLAREFNG